MNRSRGHSKTWFILFAFVIVVAGLIYWRYTYYRTPLTQSTNDVVQELLSDTSREVLETDEVFHSIPLDEIVVGNPDKDGIPSIDDPTYESVWSADLYLDDNGYGLAVEVSDEHRFYPYQILVWHEIVNDTFNGENLLVTYCPLCYTGLVYDRTFGDEAVSFGVSGKLWNSNLLMYDRSSDSLWSQVLGEAVVGERTGATLDRYPSLTISWADFKNTYPDGEVLSRETGYNRDYTQDPYEPEGYYTSSAVWFPLSHEDDRLGVKDVIFGYQSDDAQKAYALETVESVEVINDTVGEDAILLAWDTELETVRGFSRQVGQDVLTFSQGEDFYLDDQTGSLWNSEGECVGGEYLGVQLETLVLENAFWFSWAAAYPETELFTQ